MRKLSLQLEGIRRRSGYIGAKVSICFTCFSIVLCLIETCVGYNVPDSLFSIQYYILELTTLLFFSFAPFCGSICIVVCWIVSYEVPYTTTSMYICIGFAATFVSGFLCFWLSAVLDLVLMSFLLVADAMRSSDQNSLFGNDLMIFVLMLSLTFIGYFVCSQIEREKHVQRLAIQYDREHVIAELHNKVCDDLSFALRQLNSSDVISNRDIEDVRKAVERALKNTRLVLDDLYDDNLYGDSSDLLTSYSDESFSLVSFVQEQEQRLISAGFSGIIIGLDSNNNLEFPIYNIDDMYTDFISGFIREIFNNILSHADPAFGYVFTIGVTSNILSITISDTPLLGGQLYQTKDRSGDLSHHRSLGMDFYQKKIRQLGGKCDILQTNKLWTMDVSLPLVS